MSLLAGAVGAEVCFGVDMVGFVSNVGFVSSLVVEVNPNLASPISLKNRKNKPMKQGCI
jgi:hypothetical protein